MKKLDRTFGVEIEFGLKSNLTREDFKAEFEMRTGETMKIIGAYNTGNSPTDWILGVDSTVDVPNYRGYELKSPPIKLSEIDRLKKVYEYLNEVGKVNKSCGQHIHIDANDLTFKQQKKVLIAYLVNEDVIDMMHPMSRRFGMDQYNRRISNGSAYCGSGAGRQNITASVIGSQQNNLMNRLLSHYKSVVINQCIKIIKKARSVRRLKGNGFSDKYSNVKFDERYGTIEFRQHAGTLEYSKIANWIIFLNNFVIGYAYGPAVAMKDETRSNGRDRLFFRKVSQLEKSTKTRVKKYGGFDIPNSERSYEFLKGRISHFVRSLNGMSDYEKAMRIILENRGVTFRLGGTDESR